LEVLDGFVLLQAVEDVFEDGLALCLWGFEGDLDHADEIEAVDGEGAEDPFPIGGVGEDGDVDQADEGEVAHEYVEDEENQQQFQVDLGADEAVGHVE
jgi:hypothetical protein